MEGEGPGRHGGGRQGEDRSQRVLETKVKRYSCPEGGSSGDCGQQATFLQASPPSSAWAQDPSVVQTGRAVQVEKSGGT